MRIISQFCVDRRSLRYTVYSWVTRGLFEKHRLTFLTQVTFGLLQVMARLQLGKAEHMIGANHTLYLPQGVFRVVLNDAEHRPKISSTTIWTFLKKCEMM